jgi:NAD(P)-dependent dehydrogenase (short-subunit alcohol dehydrogenase family)
MSDMTNRVVLYTGAAGGLGLHGTIELLKRGATVIALDNDLKKIEELNDSAANLGGKLKTIKVDLTDVQSLRTNVKNSIAEFGKIDTIINNAAIYPSKPFEEYSLEEYSLVQKVNVESAVICVQEVFPSMKANSFGRIVNITSVTFSGQWSNLSPYVASKGTLMGLARTWAREFGKYGITSNCLAPGAFPTDAEKIHPNPEEYTKWIFDHQAVKRRGHPLDVANCLLFLISEESGFITGQTINVDGGWVMN